MSIFIDEINRLKVLEQLLQKKYNTVSTLRLIMALLGIAFGSWGVAKAQSNYFYPAFVCILTFTGFIVWHITIKEELKRTKCLIRINQDYIDRSNGDWVNFQDCGNEFDDLNHAYASDLDIFGNSSLFQWITCASTFFGRSYLAELLNNPEKSDASIKKRQGAIKEIASKVNFCRELQCEGKLQGELGGFPRKLINYAKGMDKLFQHKWKEWIIIALTMCSIMTAALLLMKISIPTYIPIILFLVQSIITLFSLKCRAILNEVAGMKRNLETYRGLLTLIELQDFEDEHLLELKKSLFNDKVSAVRGLKKLDHITGAIDIKFSPVIHLLLNVVLLWDYHCVFELEAWKEQYGKHITTWLESIGKFESYVSLAVIPQISTEYAFPGFCTGDMKFSAKDLAHPLINQKNRVANNIRMENNICIITGSNMSGKTTMLRTVGINLVLAYAGAPVIAKSMQCSIMDIFTSMRIKDNLSSGISTFYAELLRIKTIVTFSHLKQPMIFLLDEIFRGTNSKDRIIGAKSLINSLNKKWIIGIVSTHDFELCDLENEDREKIRNLHFTEYYVNNEIRFDYKLKNGRCNSTNAKYLMKLAGIELEE